MREYDPDRRWAFNEGWIDGEYPIVLVVTEKEILEQYWSYWSSQMEEMGLGDLVTKEACIEAYVTNHWAWEVKDGQDLADL